MTSHAERSYQAVVDETTDLILQNASHETIRQMLRQHARDAAIWPDEIDTIIEEAHERAKAAA